MNSLKDINKKRLVSFADILIGISILMFGFYLLTPRDHADVSEKKVIIYKGDTIIQESTLSMDKIIDLDPYGVSMMVEIHDQKVRVLSSSCRQQVCVRKGWTGNIHDPIICVPNNIIIDIAGDDPEYDAISH